MASKLRDRASKTYETDFYAWANEQAARLRAGEFDGLDLDNLIEEVEGLADTKLSGVLNSARVVMEHLLKLEHSPALDPRNKWRASVREHRRPVQIDLSPRIQGLLADELPRMYAMAREERLPVCGMTASMLPRTACRSIAATRSIRLVTTGGPRPPECKIAPGTLG